MRKIIFGMTGDSPYHEYHICKRMVEDFVFIQMGNGQSW